MNPKKSIASRYGTNLVNNGHYQTITTGSSGSSITTGTVSSTSMTAFTCIPYIISTSSFTYKYPEVNIEVLGKTFKISEDTFQQLYLTQIDFHGISFYKSLKRNGLLINDNEIKNYLDNLLQAEERDDRIEEILKNL